MGEMRHSKSIWRTDLPFLCSALLFSSRSASAERTIADLGCGHLDLLLVHWPCAWRPGTQEPDTEVTLQQTWCACAAFWGGALCGKLWLERRWHTR